MLSKKLVIQSNKCVFYNLSPTEYDDEYGKFVYKILELKHFFEKEQKKLPLEI